jgi:hypothetical protein
LAPFSANAQIWLSYLSYDNRPSTVLYRVMRLRCDSNHLTRVEHRCRYYVNGFNRRASYSEHLDSFGCMKAPHQPMLSPHTLRSRTMHRYCLFLCADDVITC